MSREGWTLSMQWGVLVLRHAGFQSLWIEGLGFNFEKRSSRALGSCMDPRWHLGPCPCLPSTVLCFALEGNPGVQRRSCMAVKQLRRLGRRNLGEPCGAELLQG